MRIGVQAVPEVELAWVVGAERRRDRGGHGERESDGRGSEGHCAAQARSRLEPGLSGGSQDQREQRRSDRQDGHTERVVEEPRDRAEQDGRNGDRQQQGRPARVRSPGKAAETRDEGRQHERIGEPGVRERGAQTGDGPSCPAAPPQPAARTPAEGRCGKPGTDHRERQEGRPRRGGMGHERVRHRPRGAEDGEEDPRRRRGRRDPEQERAGAPGNARPPQLAAPIGARGAHEPEQR